MPNTPQDVCQHSSCATGQDRAEQDTGPLGYATRLAESLWRKHYEAVAPTWKPLPDLPGVLTQIDNMTWNLVRDVAAVSPFPANAGICEPETVQLMKFYAVDTLEALLAAQAHHIEKLQAKLPPTPSFAPQRVREG